MVQYPILYIFIVLFQGCGGPSIDHDDSSRGKAILEGATVVTDEEVCTPWPGGMKIVASDVEAAFLRATFVDDSDDAAFVRGPSQANGILVATASLPIFPTEYKFLKVDNREHAYRVFSTDQDAKIWDLYIDFDAFKEDGERLWRIVCGYGVNLGGGIGDSWSVSYVLGQLASGKPCFLITDLLQP